MRVLLVGDINSIHFIKWVKALSENGIKIGIFSLATLKHTQFEKLSNIQMESLQLNNSIFRTGEGSLNKIAYLKALPQLKQFIRSFQPDILHAHYASSYGILAALCKFKPFVLSVWGSDIFDFPNKNFFFKKIIQHNLNCATTILSTSEVMAKETNKYTNKKVLVTPFGVDLEKFKPLTSESNTKKLVIGTVKALEPKYGIDTLIDAFALVKQQFPTLDLHLEIVGTGGSLASLQQQVTALQLQNEIHFIGRIDNDLIPKKLNSFAVYVALSRWDSESFGVAIVEAQACQIPVVVSNKGGLPEVVAKDTTGFVVPSDDAKSAAQAIAKLIDNEDLRKQMGTQGRIRVEDRYDWNKNVNLMLQIYADTLSTQNHTAK